MDAMTRTFGGRRYRFFMSYPSKVDARKEATKLRAEGHLARIYPQEVINFWTKREYIEYELYIRKEGK